MEYFKLALNAKLSKLSENSSLSNRTFPPTKITMEETREIHHVHAYPTTPEISPTEERGFRQRLLPPSTISCSSGAFVYRKGFMLSPPAGEDESSGSTLEKFQRAMRKCAFESAFLLFNFGLVCHLRGDQIGYNTNQVKKAVKLYNMALGLVQDVLNSNGYLLLDSRLVIAILNNLGEIYYEQGHYQLSKKCFRDLSEVLISMKRSGVDRNVDQGDWVGFISNAMVLIDPKVAPAA